MLTYKVLVQYFGASLMDSKFQGFLRENIEDITEYNVVDSSYIISERTGMELGFTNDEAVFDEDDGTIFEPGNPVFSHLNLSFCYDGTSLRRFIY